MVILEIDPPYLVTLFGTPPCLAVAGHDHGRRAHVHGHLAVPAQLEIESLHHLEAIYHMLASSAGRIQALSTRVNLHRPAWHTSSAMEEARVSSMHISISTSAGATPKSPSTGR